jgi:hypothetical protein
MMGIPTEFSFCWSFEVGFVQGVAFGPMSGETGSRQLAFAIQISEQCVLRLSVPPCRIVLGEQISRRRKSEARERHKR